MEIVSDRNLRNMDEKDLFDTASSMTIQLENCIGYLEELRIANHTLRAWGIEEAEQFDKLEEKIDWEK